MLKTPARALPDALVQAEPSRRRRWPAVAVWILSALLFGMLFWVVPRASASERLSENAARLQPRVTDARAVVSAQTDRLAAITSDLDTATDARDRLLAERDKNGKRIHALEAQIKDLEAAASASSGSTSNSSDQTYSIPPYVPPQIVCTLNPNGIVECHYAT